MCCVVLVLFCVVVLSCVLSCLVLCEVCCVKVWGVCRWGVQDFRGCPRFGRTPLSRIPLRREDGSTSTNSTSASWPKSNWPKLKLAEVEQMVSALFLLFLLFLNFFSYFISFFFLFLFSSLSHLTVHFLLFCFCFLSPKTFAPEPSAGPPLRWTPQISLFFPSPAFIFILFSPLLMVLSLNFGGVFVRRDPQMCTFGLSGYRVKPRRFRVHIGRPERTPKSGKREKKARKFGPPIRGPHPSGPQASGPQASGPHYFQVWASTLRGPTLLGSHLLWSKNSKWPKSKLAEVEKKTGRSRNWPKLTAGVSHDNPRAQAHLTAPALQTPPK